MANEKQNPIRVYPPPYYQRCVKALAEYTGQSQSSIVSDAIKEKFEKMPIQERDRILRMADK